MDKPNDLHLVFSDIGSETDPGDVKAAAGFGVEIFPYQEWNYLIRRASWLASNVNEKGIVEWDIDTPYVLGSHCSYLGNRYKCIQAHAGQDPTTTAYWEQANGKATGCITMYDGSAGWVDNVTKPGWYACVAGNAAHGVPDIEDMFIKGHASDGGAGGNNEVILTDEQLPSHIHAYTDDNTNVTGGDHDHTYMATYEFDGRSANGESTDVTVSEDGLWTPYFQGPGASSHWGRMIFHVDTIPTTEAGNEHTHEVSGDTESFGIGDPISFQPAFYKTIFIRKCY